MIPVLSAAEMREADRRTIEEIGLPGAVLMENAGAAVAQAVRERFGSARRISVLCGKGNNGGDGFVVARRLLDRGATVYLLGSRQEVKGDARLHLQAYEASGGSVSEICEPPAWNKLRERALSAELLVDALLGTGLQQAPSGLAAAVIAELEAAAATTPVVAVDLPSGVSSDSGELPGPAVRATLSVTFGAPKLGHVLPPACERVGELRVADIGIPRRLLEALGARLGLLEAADAAAAFPGRAPSSHKGRFGHVLVIGGSLGKSGAAILSGLGALRAGAGLVTVATPAPILPLVASGRAELMTEPLPVDGAGGLHPEALERALRLAAEREAVVLGPGLGEQASTREFVRRFVQQCPAALVVDADGLNALASAPKPVAGELRRETPTVLTPHPGEMARLLSMTAAQVQRTRLESARRLASESGAVVLLKGWRSVVAEPGGRAAVNPTGNPGMASGGTGDVLAGILAALLARGCEAWLAAAAGAYVHGLAGDCAAERLGQEALLASDLAEALGEALRRLAPLRA